jgi:hypothetical protein
LWMLTLGCLNKKANNSTSFEAESNQSNRNYEKIGNQEFKPSVSELINISAMNWEKFDNHITSKGFQFENFKSDTNGGSSKDYTKGNLIFTKTIDYSNPKYEINTVIFCFASQSNYTFYKNELKSLGFQFVNQKGNDDAIPVVSLNYSKENFTAQLLSYKAPNGTRYCIGINRFSKL